MYIRFIKILFSLYLLVNLSFGQESFIIGIVGDQFGSYDASVSYQIMEKAVEKINIHNPDVVVHVGDIVESIRDINSFNDYQLNFQRATEILNNTNIPWIVSIGDHGVVPPTFKVNSSDRSRESWFLECSNKFETPIKDTPYYSIDVDGYHFIALYSLEHLHTDPRWGPIFLNNISTKQLTWLKDDLSKSKHSKGIIVLVHHPMWYVWSNWIEVHDILKEYPVIAVVAGHYHYDQDEGLIDGIRYLVMGSTGGVVKNTDANSGGIQEYGIMQLKNDRIDNISLYEVNSDSLLEWTPRISMDRVQAISCMLDNLFGEINLVRDEDKIFVKDDSGNKSDYLEFSSISNPIDIPIEIKITSTDTLFTDQTWFMSDTLFSESAFLAPGYNVDWANYSNVGQWYKHPKIWQARLNQKNISENVTLTFTIKFKDTLERIIKRDISYSVK